MKTMIVVLLSLLACATTTSANEGDTVVDEFLVPRDGGGGGEDVGSLPPSLPRVSPDGGLSSSTPDSKPTLREILNAPRSRISWSSTSSLPFAGSFSGGSGVVHPPRCSDVDDDLSDFRARALFEDAQLMAMEACGANPSAFLTPSAAKAVVRGYARAASVKGGASVKGRSPPGAALSLLARLFERGWDGVCAAVLPDLGDWSLLGSLNVDPALKAALWNASKAGPATAKTQRRNWEEEKQQQHRGECVIDEDSFGSDTVARNKIDDWNILRDEERFYLPSLFDTEETRYGEALLAAAETVQIAISLGRGASNKGGVSTLSPRSSSSTGGLFSYMTSWVQPFYAKLTAAATRSFSGYFPKGLEKWWLWGYLGRVADGTVGHAMASLHFFSDLVSSVTGWGKGAGRGGAALKPAASDTSSSPQGSEPPPFHDFEFLDAIEASEYRVKQLLKLLRANVRLGGSTGVRGGGGVGDGTEISYFPSPHDFALLWDETSHGRGRVDQSKADDFFIPSPSDDSNPTVASSYVYYPLRRDADGGIIPVVTTTSSSSSSSSSSSISSSFSPSDSLTPILRPYMPAAVALYAAAASLGDGEGHWNMGVLSSVGLFGVPASSARSALHYYGAALAGHLVASAALGLRHSVHAPVLVGQVGGGRSVPASSPLTWGGGASASSIFAQPAPNSCAAAAAYLAPAVGRVAEGIEASMGLLQHMPPPAWERLDDELLDELGLSEGFDSAAASASSSLDGIVNRSKGRQQLLYADWVELQERGTSFSAHSAAALAESSEQAQQQYERPGGSSSAAKSYFSFFSSNSAATGKAAVDEAGSGKDTTTKSGSGSANPPSSSSPTETHELQQSLSNFATAFRRQRSIRPSTSSSAGGTELLAFFHNAADKGDLQAHVALGHMYLLGAKGAPQNFALAAEHFHAAADLDESLAYAHLGFLYLHGLGVKADVDTAAAFLKEVSSKAAKAASAASAAAAAATSASSASPTTPATAAVAAAANSAAAAAAAASEASIIPAAYTTLGYLTLHGLGVPQDSAEAYSLFLRASMHMQPDALYNLGLMELDGSAPGGRDFKAAYSHFAAATATGHALSQYKLAIMQLNGIGGAGRDCPSAVRNFEQILSKVPILSHPMDNALPLLAAGNYPAALLEYARAAELGIEVGHWNAAVLLDEGLVPEATWEGIQVSLSRAAAVSTASQRDASTPGSRNGAEDTTAASSSSSSSSRTTSNAATSGEEQLSVASDGQFMHSTAAENAAAEAENGAAVGVQEGRTAPAAANPAGGDDVSGHAAVPKSAQAAKGSSSSRPSTRVGTAGAGDRHGNDPSASFGPATRLQARQQDEDALNGWGGKGGGEKTYPPIDGMSMKPILKWFTPSNYHSSSFAALDSVHRAFGGKRSRQAPPVAADVSISLSTGSAAAEIPASASRPPPGGRESAAAAQQPLSALFHQGDEDDEGVGGGAAGTTWGGVLDGLFWLLGAAGGGPWGFLHSSSPPPPPLPILYRLRIWAEKRRSLRLVQASAAAGYGVAHLRLGDFHYEGLAGLPPSRTKAAESYAIACTYRIAQACYNMAWMHSTGQGLARDKHMAKRFFDLTLESTPGAVVVGWSTASHAAEQQNSGKGPLDSGASLGLPALPVRLTMLYFDVRERYVDFHRDYLLPLSRSLGMEWLLVRLLPTLDEEEEVQPAEGDGSAPLQGAAASPAEKRKGGKGAATDSQKQTNTNGESSSSSSSSSSGDSNPTTSAAAARKSKKEAAEALDRENKLRREEALERARSQREAKTRSEDVFASAGDALSSGFLSIVDTIVRSVRWFSHALTLRIATLFGLQSRVSSFSPDDSALLLLSVLLAVVLLTRTQIIRLRRHAELEEVARRERGIRAIFEEAHAQRMAALRNAAAAAAEH